MRKSTMPTTSTRAEVSSDRAHRQPTVGVLQQLFLRGEHDTRDVSL